MLSRLKDIITSSEIPLYEEVEEQDLLLILLSKIKLGECRISRISGVDYYLAESIDNFCFKECVDTNKIVRETVNICNNVNSQIIVDLLSTIPINMRFSFDDFFDIILEKVNTSNIPNLPYLLRMLVESGCYKSFLHFSSGNMWSHKLCESTDDVKIRRTLLTQNVHALVTGFGIKSKLTYSSTLFDSLTIWDASMLALSGACKFDARIASLLWENKPQYHWYGTLRAASFDVRTFLFLESKNVSFIKEPIFDGMEMFCTVEHKPKSAEHVFSPITFSWMNSLCNSLFTAYSDFVINSTETIESIDSDIDFITERYASYLTKERTKNVIGQMLFSPFIDSFKQYSSVNKCPSDIESAATFVLDRLYRLICSDALILPSPLNDGKYLQDILREFKPEYKACLIKDALSRREKEKWIKETKNKKQLVFLLNFYNIEPYSLLDEKYEEKTMSILRELVF